MIITENEITENEITENDESKQETLVQEKPEEREDSSCPICLTHMDAPDSLCCGHKFHRECVQHWFNISKKQRCPICRTDESGNSPNGSGNGNVNGGNLTGNDDITSLAVILDDEDLNFFYDTESHVDPLFGSFTTPEGDVVFVYESSLGIIMIRTWNIPNDSSFIPPPNGTVVVPLPTFEQRRDAFRTIRRRQRGRMSRFFSHMKRNFLRWWHHSS